MRESDSLCLYLSSNFCVTIFRTKNVTLQHLILQKNLRLVLPPLFPLLLFFPLIYLLGRKYVAKNLFPPYIPVRKKICRKKLFPLIYLLGRKYVAKNCFNKQAYPTRRTLHEGRHECRRRGYDMSVSFISAQAAVYSSSTKTPMRLGPAC